ncbi:MAG: hypothetical protein KUG82_07640 [Pseudomonadales bacterium]|nr:hypothetical protein [Pseudomonadales bacterium]
MQTRLMLILCGSTLLAACGGSSDNSDPLSSRDLKDNIELANIQKVLNTNADIAHAIYTDSVATAEDLQTALSTFKASPTAENLDAAKRAWLIAREPYGQSEVYRFRLSPIDSTNYSDEDGPEGDINAWPLGEALIDYVVTGDDFGTGEVGVTEHDTGVNGNDAVTAENHAGNNIIATTSITIDSNLLASNASADDEHDVIAGYHAIEFLLWGQDLNDSAQVTSGDDRDEAVKSQGAANIATGGQRPVSDFQPGFEEANDYDSSMESHRRHQYLQVAVTKLISDLTDVRDAWASDASYRTAFTAISDENDALQKLTEILTGMATLSEGELAGERMQISYSTNSQEDEHSCFSDNTHRDIWLNAEGVSNSYFGSYAGYDSSLDGTDNQTDNAVSGYGLADLLADAGSTALASQIEAALSTTETSYNKIDESARNGSPVDVLIMDANRDSSNPMFETIIALNAQSVLITELAEQLGIDDDVADDEASGCDTTNPDSDCG